MTTHPATDPHPDPTRPVIDTDEDLLDFWRSLIIPGEIEAPAFWILLIDPSGVPLRQLMEITEPPGFPDRADVRALAQFLRAICSTPELPGMRVAPLVVRTGPASPVTPTDLAWASTYHRAAVLAGVPCEPVHLAGDDEVIPLPLGDYLPDVRETRLRSVGGI